MKIVQKIKKTVHNLTRPTVSLDDKELLEWLGITPSSKKAVAEVTYYTCLKMLSETIGKMPLKYYQQTDKGRIRAEPTEAGILMTVRPNREWIYLGENTVYAFRLWRGIPFPGYVAYAEQLRNTDHGRYRDIREQGKTLLSVQRSKKRPAVYVPQ